MNTQKEQVIEQLKTSENPYETMFQLLNGGLSVHDNKAARQLYAVILTEESVVPVKYLLPLARRMVAYVEDKDFLLVKELIEREYANWDLYDTIFGHYGDVEAEKLAFIGNTIVKEILIKNKEMN